MRILQLAIFTILISCRSTSGLVGYSPNDILLTLDETSVTAGEFIYSFDKSHQNEDTITTASIDDYLQLFINYKLKVIEAKSLGYDTAKAYIDELTGYQEQLKSSYRTSEKIAGVLRREAYERMKQEVNASHILLRLPEDASPEDTLQVYEKIMAIREEAKERDFSELAAAYSEDPSAKINNGDLGYFTAFRMLYQFENAAYATEVGETSMPVRTEYGYHILKIHDKRPSAYKVKLHQLQLNAKIPESSMALRDKVFEVHEMLKGGLEPGQIAGSIDNERFVLKQGPLPILAPGQMPPEIQQVASHLNSPGDVSDPVKSDFGWHIFLLQEKVPFPSYEEMATHLDRMVRRTGRFAVYKDQLMNRLAEKHDVVMHVKKESINVVVNENHPDKTLFSINQSNFSLGRFLEYLDEKNIGINNTEAVENNYLEYINEQIREIEDKEIIAANPDLKWLLKEYKEGMLLFNIMEDSVWNRAINDKQGFEKFQQENDNATMITKDSALVKTNTGAIVDYQQFLEEQWIKRLRAKHEIKINQQVLDKVVMEILHVSE